MGAKELDAYYRVVRELHDQATCQAPSTTRPVWTVPHPAWAALQRHIAAIYWCFLNLMPYERGSSTTGLLLHQALLMAAFPSKRLRTVALTRCLPMFRSQLLPDWEALAAPLEEFVTETWWALFDGEVKLECFHEIL